MTNEMTNEMINEELFADVVNATPCETMFNFFVRGYGSEEQCRDLASTLCSLGIQVSGIVENEHDECETTIYWSVAESDVVEVMSKLARHPQTSWIEYGFQIES